MIALIDYKAGNLTSVRKAFAALGAELYTPERPAGLVIDQRNHSRPLVLGSIFASRLSFATATRRARANALNTASTW